MLRSGDPVADREAREGFAERAAERTYLQHVGDDFAVLSVGNDYWPFAIPLVRDKSGWFFDTAAGKTELLNRRVGRNELYTIQVCQDYVSAQRDFARRRKAATGIAEYAQHLRSTPGSHDGLYWETKSGDMESPIGPLLASATREGYSGAGKSGEPFHGYLFRALREGRSERPGRSAQLRRERPHDARLRIARISGPLWRKRCHDVPGERTRCRLPKGPRATNGRDCGGMTAYDPDDSWYPTD